jgi:beta-phosphoglucomutase-like phosphatase (HAD superfamily)
MMPKALIFDVDGTLADTEAAHRSAFNQAFSEFGLDWLWDDNCYTRLLDVSGGKERMQHYWTTEHPEVGEIGGLAMPDVLDRLHALKTRAYEAAVADGAVLLRPGVLRLLDEALSQGIQLAIATTTSPANIAALFRMAIGADWRTYFCAIGDASTAAIKKPHPQVYLQVLEVLQMPADACIAFEDSSNGLRASTAAALATVVTPTSYTHDQDFSDAMRVLPDLSQVDLCQLRSWHADFMSARATQATH